MSNATELLRRALKDLEEGLRPIRKVELIEEIRTFLEVEEQYDALSEHYVEGLGNSMKACKESFEREAERVKELLAAEPEAEPVYQIAMAEGSTSTAWIDVAKDVFDDAGMYPEYKRRALYTRPEPARKPMSEEELENVFRECHGNFEKIVRAIEKHHGIDGNPSEIISNQRFDKFDPNSIDLQSRCRGDKL